MRLLIANRYGFPARSPLNCPRLGGSDPALSAARKATNSAAESRRFRRAPSGQKRGGMKHGKRKSNRRPVSKERIRQASYAKSHGLLSKRAKLGNGRLSRAVNKKLDVLSTAKAVPTYEFHEGQKRATIATPAERKGVKVTREQLARAKEAGLLTVGNKVIIPRKGDYQKALDEGLTAGHRPATEDSGAVDTILLSPLGIRNFADLYRALNSGVIDHKYLGDTKRLYAFTIFGYHPRAGATFLDGPMLVDYLQKYQWDTNEEAFQNFELLTVPYGSHLGPTPASIRDFNRLRFRTRQDRREGQKRSHHRSVRKAMKLDQLELDQKHADRMKQYRLVKGESLRVKNRDRMRQKRATLRET
jgi:hypothetical protein